MDCARISRELRSEYAKLFTMILDYKPKEELSGIELLHHACRSKLIGSRRKGRNSCSEETIKCSVSETQQKRKG